MAKGNQTYRSFSFEYCVLAISGIWQLKTFRPFKKFKWIYLLHCVLHWCAMKNLHLRFISDLVVSKSEERRNHYYCSRARAATQSDQNHSSFVFEFLVLFTLSTFINIQKWTKPPSFLMIFGAEYSFLKKSLLDNWLFWTHFWIPWDILLWKT